MPIILDANRSGDFSRPQSGHAREILDRINRRMMRVVVSRPLLSELSRTPIGMILAECSRLGLLIRADDAECNNAEDGIDLALIRSNDIHILALALCTDSRLLYTDDGNLIRDFKNSGILQPRGRVVKSTTPHRHACRLFETVGR